MGVVEGGLLGRWNRRWLDLYKVIGDTNRLLHGKPKASARVCTLLCMGGRTMSELFSVEVSITLDVTPSILVLRIHIEEFGQEFYS